MKPGMVLAKSVDDANGLVIVSEGTTITENTSQRLVDLGIPLVYIEDPRFDDLEVTETANTELVRDILEFRRSSREIIASQRSPDTIRLDMDVGIRLAEVVLESVQKSTPEEFSLVQHLPAESYWDAHAINSSLLAARLATTLAMDRDTVLQLVLVCLFHDLSHVLPPKSILENLGRFNENEKKALYIHPKLEVEILRRQQGVSAVAIGAIGEHHELWNGEGYPRGLSGESILPVARIVGLVDTYAALVSERPFRKRLMPHEAIEYILGYADEYFEIDLAERFSRSVPTYFIGTMVSLNNNQKGVVTFANIGDVARPIVRAITDPDGVPLSKPTDVDLSDPANASLLITAVVDG